MKNLFRFCTILIAASWLAPSALAKDGKSLEAYEAEARTVLMQFFDPGRQADLMQELRPELGDLRVLYEPMLAVKLERLYLQLYKPGVKLSPKPKQTELLTFVARLSDLKNQTRVARNFAGGHKQVAPFIRSGQPVDPPVVRFKFVEPGQTLGLSVDALYFVNDRWVLVPRPWKGVTDEMASNAGSASAPTPTTDPELPKKEAEARSLLLKSFNPDNQAAFVQAVRPTREDLDLLYPPEIAGRLEELYATWFAPGARIGPKSGQTELLTTPARLSDLRDQKEIARKFAGGHKWLAPFVKTPAGPDPVVVRFKYVKPGETRGMSFDSLYWLNNRWVLIPKPWRGVDR